MRFSSPPRSHERAYGVQRRFPFRESALFSCHSGDTFVEEFRKRRGYDPIPYLPALKGMTFSDPNIAPRFLHDYRMTVSDLWIDGHYRAGTRFLNRHGIKLVADSGHGGYPRTDPVRSLGVVDIPRGEFWNGSQFWVVKEAASAAHVYGRQIVDAESFTGWRNWQDGPLEYKRLADTAFCDGLNRITFHTFAHTPPEGGVPGLMYHAGEHFNLNSTWWNQSGPMLSYFSRCCYLLQQGLPVADVCLYYGDDAPNLVATRPSAPIPNASMVPPARIAGGQIRPPPTPWGRDTITTSSTPKPSGTNWNSRTAVSRCRTA